jgi:putative ABC transport system substrate-binding protein
MASRWVKSSLVGLLVLACPPGAVDTEAQPTVRAHRVGFVTLNPAVGNTAPILDAFRQGLRELGYGEGKNLTIEARFADGRREALAGLVQQLLTARVDVVVTLGTPATVAAREGMKGVPIVFVGVGDPVGSGFAASLARPGGNLTGVSFVGPELAAKNLELLKQAVPEASRVAVLVPGGTGAHPPLVRAVWAELERAARALQVTLDRWDVAPAPERLDDVLAAVRGRRPDALLTLNDPFFLVHRERILGLAGELRLPTMFQTADYVRAGGLLAYVPNLADFGALAAGYVDRILTGARPAELAIQQPTRFVLTVNMKTARALGLSLAPSLLVRADHIIDE